jgi:hypothetical protein
MDNKSHLFDLDELILLCRDEKARAYINEAASCYRAGAFRASIVVTWVSVCYDIIDKLREIALSGDKEASNAINAIEEARIRNDISFLLKFERGILDLAENKFELLSKSERIDLERLQDDRNRCAHPSMISEDQSFDPPGELARLHIRSAVIHLLQHQPVQGKYALERVLKEVGSSYFPTTRKEATITLSAGPLKRARKSLIKSFCTVLIKELISETLEYKRRFRLEAALQAAMTIHHTEVIGIVKEQIPKILLDIPDQRLGNLARLITSIPESMDALTDNIRGRIVRYIENIPTEEFGSLEIYHNCVPLRIYAEKRMRIATSKDFDDSLFFDLPPLLCERLIELYISSKSLAEANWGAQTLMHNISDLSSRQRLDVVTNIKSNDQLLNSNTLLALIDKIRLSKDMLDEEFDKLLSENKLEKYVGQNAKDLEKHIDDDIPF